MKEIVWSPQAKNDLQEIYDHIAADSFDSAELMINHIIERVGILTDQPFSGRKVPEINQNDIREVFKGNYRIIYSLESASSISILRVIHFSRLLPA